VLLHTLLALWPESRVTFLASRGSENTGALEDLLAVGVEGLVLNDEGERWFEDRRFHYDSVFFLDPLAAKSFGPLLSNTQPQAYRFVIDGHSRTTDGSVRILEVDFDARVLSERLPAALGDTGIGPVEPPMHARVVDRQ
jgi:hypothetical protein